MFFNIKSKLGNNFEPLLFKMLLNILQNPRIHFPLKSLMLISNGERSLCSVRSLVKCKQRSTERRVSYSVCDKLPMMVNYLLSRCCLGNPFAFSIVPRQEASASGSNSEILMKKNNLGIGVSLI